VIAQWVATIALALLGIVGLIQASSDAETHYRQRGSVPPGTLLFVVVSAALVAAAIGIRP